MARTTQTTKSTKPAVPLRKPGTRGSGRPTTAAAKSPARVKKPAAGSKRVPVAAPAVPKLSRDELRARVEKLETANATLRAKNRAANRAAKAGADRIAELENQLAQLQKKVSRAAPSSRRDPKTAAPSPGKRKIDPGDAVPPGAAVREPAPLDEEAKTVLENLEDLEASNPPTT